MKLILLLLFLAIPPLAHTQTVYRCGNSYASSPCPGGRALSIAPAPRVSQDRSTVPVYRCKAYSGGGVFWSSRRCDQMQATLDRIVNVPGDMPWDQQVELARAAHQQAATLAKSPTPVVRYASTPDTTQRCRWLDERIASLDSAARAGGTVRRMEWLNEQRRKARDEQSRLQCR